MARTTWDKRETGTMLATRDSNPVPLWPCGRAEVNHLSECRCMHTCFWCAHEIPLQHAIFWRAFLKTNFAQPASRLNADGSDPYIGACAIGHTSNVVAGGMVRVVLLCLLVRLGHGTYSCLSLIIGPGGWLAVFSEKNTHTHIYIYIYIYIYAQDTGTYFWLLVCGVSTSGRLDYNSDDYRTN
jgi:hypothetical protein